MNSRSVSIRLKAPGIRDQKTQVTGDWETSDSLISSFRAKREIFFVCGLAVDQEPLGHRFILIRGEAAILIPHVSRAFICHQGQLPPRTIQRVFFIGNAFFDETLIKSYSKKGGNGNRLIISLAL